MVKREALLGVAYLLLACFLFIDVILFPRIALEFLTGGVSGLRGWIYHVSATGFVDKLPSEADALRDFLAVCVLAAGGTLLLVLLVRVLRRKAPPA